MKRCPQCQFIYPDSDSVCDFDQSTLVTAPESEIAAITNTPERPALAELAATHSQNFEKRKNRRTLPLAGGLGLLLSIIVCGVYLGVRRQMPTQPSQKITASVPTASVVTLYPSPSPTPSVSTSPSPDQVEAPDEPSSTTPKTTTSHPRTSLGAVSTGPPGTEVKSAQKPVILLTTGGKVEADAVWRTKDGVWYRRDGVVTLLKKNRVKALVSQ